MRRLTNVDWEVLRATLRRRRLDLGLTQEQVGQRMGRSQDYVSILENNTRSIPNLATVILWAAALGGTISIDFTGPQEAAT